MKPELSIPISPGEMVDRLTILQLKLENIKDSDKLSNIYKEYSTLKDIWNASYYCNVDIKQQTEQLYEVNSRIWNTEDCIRYKEKLQEFDSEFIKLARSIYRSNDLRAKLKKDINIKLDSYLVEEKSYEDY